MLATNGAGLVAASVFAVIGARRPQYIKPGTPSNVLTRFWSLSSALRTLSITVPLLAQLGAKSGPDRRLLAVAGVVQLGDAALGIWQRDRAMATAPALMGVIHLATARTLRR